MFHRYEIIEIAKRLGLTVELASHPAVKQLINEVVKQTEDRFMQLFLDPENQPTQFGTVTKEYMWGELNAVISAARLLHNLTLADPTVKISTCSSEKKNAIVAAGENLKEAILARGRE